MEQSNKTDHIEEKVQYSLEKIRPYLVSDGGDVKLVDITEDMVVKVKLTGACETCQLNLSTLKSGIESLIIKDIPEIKRVDNVDNIDE